MRLAALVVLAACSHATADAQIARDWSVHPAIVEIDDADEIYALSDPHGGAKELAALLEANHVSSGKDWKAGTAILVVAGDLIDKGPDSLGVIDLLRALESSAKAKGGRVVVTLGNHEAELFADPQNKKATSTGNDATGIDNQLAAQKIAPADFARGADAAGRGRWLLDLPFGVRIKKWFFSHGGNTGGDSIAALGKRLQKAVDKHGFSDKDITGKDSILEAQAWYGDQDKDDIGKRNAAALGVEHVVFGHDPGAFGEHGQIRASKDGSLIKLDVEMGLHGKKANTGGLLLHIKTKGKDSAEVLDAKGHADPLL
jgi:3',5'-cyclic AMP phosphodiesterase CpdA